MAIIQTDRNIDLGQIIIQALRKSGGGSRNIHDIEQLLHQEYGYSLHYSKNNLFTALERLVHEGVHIDNFFHRLNIKINARFLRKPEIKFWLLSISDENTPQASSVISTNM